MHIPFFKYQGTGNDFVMIDNRTAGYEDLLSTADIAHICRRRMGVGADGLILLSPSTKADFRMIYYNADGHESSMCGNGGRCIVAFAHQLGMIGERCVFDAVDGLHEAVYETGGQVRLRMISPHGYREMGPGQQWIHTGSPHYVAFREENLSGLNVFQEGRAIRYSPEFAPGGTNVNFVNVLEKGHIRVRTYERGVEDETLSCGTGVTACAYLYLQHFAPSLSGVSVRTEGGELRVEVKQPGTYEEEVWLCGPAVSVFSGSLSL